MTALAATTEMVAKDARPVEPVEVREAVAADNAQLVALTSACPMRGDLTLRMDRGPNFFALHRLEGERSQLGVVERTGKVVGCISVSEREVYLNGRKSSTGYVGDLKVHPLHRDTATADALCMYATAQCGKLPVGSPTLVTVLAGNKAMEKRLSGPRGLPSFQKLTTIRAYSISILWKRRLRALAGMTVERAQWRDLHSMAALWQETALQRQFAGVLDSAAMARFIERSPGLEISSYLIARSRSGQLLGFLALWDQSAIKQMYVESYSPRLSLVKKCFNAVAPIIGSEPLPESGEPLRHQTVFQVCVPPDRPDVLRSLLITGHNELRSSRCSFFNVGLDIRDPLSCATEGLLGQPTDVNAYITYTSNPGHVSTLQGLPLHYEIALV
jgi:Acetyltransferase (GNAT) domain